MLRDLHPWLAEREGFEPPNPLRSTVFKTAAFNRSAISPIFHKTHLTPDHWYPQQKGLQI